MDNHAFTAGVVPGGLTNEREIKILICHTLSQLDQPLSHSLLIGGLSKNGLVNYFECADALSDLVAAGNIRLTDEAYTATASGKNIADTLFRDIPLTVRDRAAEIAKDALTLQKNQRQHITETRKTENGYIVRCHLDDGGGEIFSMQLFSPNRRYAQNIERNFVMKGESLISDILAELTTDTDD